MKKQTLFLLLGVFIIAFASCLREDPNLPTGSKENFTSLQIDENFEFKNTREINLEVAVLDQVKSMIEVYNGNPDTEGVLIKKGITNENSIFSTLLVLPGNLSDIYVVRHSYDGTVMNQKIPVTSINLVYHFGYKAQKSSQAVSNLVNPGTWPDCASVVNFSVPNNYSGDLDIPANEKWRIETGNTYTGELDFPSWGDNYLIICGSATIDDLKSGVGNIIVTGTGTLYLEDDFSLSSGSNLINYGTVEVKSGSSWKNIIMNGGHFENHGTLSANEMGLTNTSFLNTGNFTLSDKFEVNSINGTNTGAMAIEKDFKMASASCVFENFNTIYVGEDSKFYGTFYNYDGTLYFEKKMEFSGGSSTVNNCKIIVDGDLKIVDDVDNNGYIECGGKIDVISGSIITMGEGSLISTEDLKLQGDIDGPTSAYAKVKIDDKTELKYGSSVIGKVDICDISGVNENNATIGAEVTYCVNEVPNTACVPGNGISFTDQDSDGVPDNLDEYPTDPLRAMNSYYPNAADFGTFAFEDLWPDMGDYDFNDLILNFQYQTVTNANNQIVDLVARFEIKAAGATYNNGFGFSFDALPAAVASVTGTHILGSGISLAANGLEAGHTSQSVVIVYDMINNFTGQSMLNTNLGSSLIDIPMSTVTINFATPQASLGTEPFNPFIYINQVRGREVHMTNYEPTQLVDPSYFGTESDASAPASSIYYRTPENYPFAIETPVKLDYPGEKKDIVTVHLKFASWAQSSGISYPDWYQNQTGYRDNTKIIGN